MNKMRPPLTSPNLCIAVQFARGVHDDAGYAIKLFVSCHEHGDSQAAFDCERAMCYRHDLRDSMPAVKDVRERGCGGAVQNARGRWEWAADGAMPCGKPYPPCIVAERGLAMDEWAVQMQPSFIKSLQVRFACRSSGTSSVSGPIATRG